MQILHTFYAMESACVTGEPSAGLLTRQLPIASTAVDSATNETPCQRPMYHMLGVPLPTIGPTRPPAGAWAIIALLRLLKQNILHIFKDYIHCPLVLVYMTMMCTHCVRLTRKSSLITSTHIPPPHLLPPRRSETFCLGQKVQGTPTALTSDNPCTRRQTSTRKGRART